MRLRNTDRAPRSSGRRSNVKSRISEIKDTSNMAVRKKRRRRAPPSAKRLRDKRVDKAIESDGAVDSDSDGTDGQVDKSQPSAHIEEHVDGRTGDDLAKAGHSGNSSDGPSSASEEQDHSANSKGKLQKSSTQNTKKVFGNSTNSKQGASHLEQEGANEEVSHVQVAAVYKDIDNERSSQKIRDDVSHAQVDATSSDDKSSEEVEDVKVCDICGDVGEEEKLAVCSRCNDGAEHTYCMRVMIEEVPDSEWLCEDCQTAVESEKENRLEKSQVKVGTTKELPFEGEINKPAIAAKSRSSSDCELKAENIENKESDTTDEGNDMVKTKTEEDAAMTSSIRDTIPETSDLYMGAESRKRMQPSHEIFVSDADKGKQPSHQMATSSVVNPLKNQAPQSRGQLSKSTSFNSSKVPKVKQIVNEVPQKPKILKESWSSIITKKEGPINMTTKSATFKKPKPCEPENKAKSSILSPAEEPRVTNQLVSHSATNGQCSILGPPSAKASMIAPILKTGTTAQFLSTRNNTSDSNNLGAVHVQGGKNSLGNSELKKPPLAKLPGSMMLFNAERSSGGILGSGAHRKVIQNSDPSHRDTKIKDQTGFRQGAASSNRTIRCQRCNEVGHSAQFCGFEKLGLSSIKPLSERNLKDASAKRNKTSETTLASSEKVPSREENQSEHIIKCGTYQNLINGPKDVLPAPFSHVKKPSLLPRANVQDMGYTLSIPGGVVDYSKLKFKDNHPSLSATGGISADNGCIMSNDHRDEPAQVFSAGDEPMASTVPELDWIWQGGFELQRIGRSPELCDGFQAHLSCSASQLVLDVVKKFPSKVQLEEVPRQNSWPTQFQKNGPTYDNIGLFFFARDVQSYENHYSKLVENMLKNDLVLRGSVGTVELLIFPSNILSKNFQRWNMFYFLWGLFRVSKKDSSNLPSYVSTSRPERNFNDDPQAMDCSTSALPSTHSFSQNRSGFAELGPNLVKSTNFASSLETSQEVCMDGELSLNQPLCRRALDSDIETSSISNGALGSSTMSMQRKHQLIPGFATLPQDPCAASPSWQMAAAGGRCLLAMALVAAWISGAVATASSSAEQEGGSHKPVKCMPCSRAYIGDAYLDDTLTGQLAQRRDLVDMSGSGELCIGLADDVEVPVLSKLRRQLVGEGSHRCLVYSVDLGACEGAMVNSLDGYDAHLVIVEKLPDGVFADPFELQHFVERKVFVDVAVFGDTNLELPTALSNRSSVEIHFDLRLIIPTNCNLVIEMPLHARYPPLDARGYATVEFGSPDLFLRYRKKEIHSDSCLWVIKNLKAPPLEKAAWRIPCGDEGHIGFVSSITFLSALVCSMSIVLAALIF